MKTAVRVVLVVALIGVLSGVALAQITSSSISNGPNGYAARVTIQPPRMVAPAIAGAPYSADQVTEHTQTLADGTHIRQSQRAEHLYRDSSGRTRSERPFFMGPNAPQDLPLITEITDPLAGVQYVLDPESHVAHRYTLESRPVPMFKPPAAGDSGVSRARVTTGEVSGSASSVSSTGAVFGGGYTSTVPVTQQRQPATGTAAAPPRQQTKMEKLGTQVIEGVAAEGTRWTTVMPEGSVGNDRPFSTVRESWTSPDLKTVVMSKYDDPRNGEQVTKLININRAEPDASLFLPPADYRIVDETEAVTITFKRQ